MPFSSSINNSSSSNAAGPDPRVIQALKEYESSREFQASVLELETGASSSSRRGRSLTTTTTTSSNNNNNGGPDPQVMESLKRFASTREQLRGCSLTTTPSQQQDKRASFASSSNAASSSMNSTSMMTTTSDDDDEEEDKNVKRLLKLENKMDDLDQQIFWTREMVRVRLLDTHCEMAAVISMKHCLKLEAQREQVLRKLKQTTTTDLPGSEFTTSSHVGGGEEKHNHYHDHRSYSNEQVLAIAKSRFGKGSSKKKKLGAASQVVVVSSSSKKKPQTAAAHIRSTLSQQQQPVRC